MENCIIGELQAIDESFNDRTYVQAQVQKLVMKMKEFTKEMDLVDPEPQENLPECIYKFYRDAEETVGWITEKNLVFSSDEFGQCLASAQTSLVRAPLTIALSC